MNAKITTKPIVAKLALAAAFLAGTFISSQITVGQELDSNGPATDTKVKSADPVESMALSIMEQVFGTSATVTAQTAAPLPRTSPWDGMRAAAAASRTPMPLFADRMAMPMQPAMPFGANNEFAAEMQRRLALTRLPVPKDAPIAYSAAVANGAYDIEAVLPTADGPQKVKLRGSRAEVESQFRALPKAMQHSLAPKLGLIP